MPNSRRVIDSWTRRLSSLTDQRIRSQGEFVVITYPTEESENLYHDRLVSQEATLRTAVVFNWDDYRRLLEFSDEFTELETPLEAVAAVGDHIPVGSVMHIPTKHPSLDNSEPPSDADIIQAKASFRNNDNQFALTMSNTLSEVDTRGILGNHWTLILNVEESFSDDVETDTFSVNKEDRRLTYNTLNTTSGAEVASQWTYGSAEGSDDASLEDLDTGTYLIRFSGGKGYGIGTPEYSELDFISQSREFRVVKNEVKHEHFSYERRLTLLPKRGPSY